MNTTEITIRVEPSVAQNYLASPDEKRRKLDTLLSLRLSEALQPSRNLQEVIRDASAEAQAKGLTPEILEELLDGE